MYTTEMLSYLLSVILLLHNLPSSIQGTRHTNIQSYVYDVYPGLKIDSGFLLENFESRLMHPDDVGVFCLMKCEKNPECSMLTLEKISHFNCSLWKFDKTHDVLPSFNVNSTLYTKKNCESSHIFYSPNSVSFI